MTLNTLFIPSTKQPNAYLSLHSWTFQSTGKKGGKYQLSPLLWGNLGIRFFFFFCAFYYPLLVLSNYSNCYNYAFIWQVKYSLSAEQAVAGSSPGMLQTLCDSPTLQSLPPPPPTPNPQQCGIIYWKIRVFFKTEMTWIMHSSLSLTTARRILIRCLHFSSFTEALQACPIPERTHTHTYIYMIGPNMAEAVQSTMQDHKEYTVCTIKCLHSASV